MIRELKDTYSYKKVITLISVLSFVFGIGVCLFGELLLPFASAFLAALFLFENPKKRILSYIFPVLSIAIGILITGFSALIAAEYVLLAVIMVACYRFSISKAECSVYMTITIALFIFLSLYLAGAAAINDFSLNAVKEHYVELFNEFKTQFVDFVSEFKITADDGSEENAMSVEDASYYFGYISKLLVSIIATLSFLIAGISIKLFSWLILRYSKHGILKTYSHFLPSNLCAYAYIISAIISIFSSEASEFGITIMNINQIFIAVFAYMGLKYLLMVSKLSPRKLTMYFLIAAGFIAFPNIAPEIVSYLGVWVVIGTNNHNKITMD